MAGLVQTSKRRSSDSDLTVTTKQDTFELNKVRALKKKQAAACRPDDIVVRMKGQNVVIEFSTAMLELFKQALQECNIKPDRLDTDRSKNSHRIIYKITSERGEYLYTINIYLTTSSCMVNGVHEQVINQFLKKDLPHFIECTLNNLQELGTDTKELNNNISIGISQCLDIMSQSSKATNENLTPKEDTEQANVALKAILPSAQMEIPDPGRTLSKPSEILEENYQKENPLSSSTQNRTNSDIGSGANSHSLLGEHIPFAPQHTPDHGDSNSSFHSLPPEIIPDEESEMSDLSNCISDSDSEENGENDLPDQCKYKNRRKDKSLKVVSQMIKHKSTLGRRERSTNNKRPIQHSSQTKKQKSKESHMQKSLEQIKVTDKKDKENADKESSESTKLEKNKNTSPNQLNKTQEEIKTKTSPTDSILQTNEDPTSSESGTATNNQPVPDTRDKTLTQATNKVNDATQSEPKETENMKDTSTCRSCQSLSAKVDLILDQFKEIKTELKQLTSIIGETIPPTSDKIISSKRKKKNARRQQRKRQLRKKQSSHEEQQTENDTKDGEEQSSCMKHLTDTIAEKLNNIDSSITTMDSKIEKTNQIIQDLQKQPDSTQNQTIKGTSTNNKEKNNLEGSLLIADDTLTGIQVNYVEQSTEVLVVKDARIHDIKSLLQQAGEENKKYTSIYIHVGTHDSESTSVSDVIEQNINEMISVASDICNNVVISSICPRLDEEMYLLNSIDINQMYLNCCNDNNTLFIDHDLNFRLANGSVNEHFILRNSAQLTQPGLKQLLINLGICKNGTAGDKQEQNKRDTTSKTDNIGNKQPHNLKDKSETWKSDSRSKKSISVQGHKDKLSNFHPCKLKYKDITFDSSEQLFQYKRWEFHASSEHNKEDEITLKLIMNSRHAGEAKRVADQRIKDSETWTSNAALETMTEILDIKASQSEDFSEALLQTGNTYLLHTVPDTYWGEGTQRKKGDNMYGILLMKLRTKLKEKNRPTFDYKPVDHRAYADVLSGHTRTHSNSVRSDRHDQNATQKQMNASSDNEWNPVYYGEFYRSDREQTQNRDSREQLWHRCHYCYETGHSKDSCGFKHPVKCYNCHTLGHKAKFCDYY